MAVNRGDLSDVKGVMLGDPLGENTRRVRRNLLAVSAIGIAMGATGLVPTQIPAFGIEFTQSDRSGFLIFVGAIVVYYLFAFAIYGSSDWASWLLAVRRSRIMSGEQQGQDSVAREALRFRMSRTTRWVFILAAPASFVRASFEFLIPIGIAIYSTVALATVDLATAV